MNDYIEERSCDIANYIIDKKLKGYGENGTIQNFDGFGRG